MRILREDETSFELAYTQQADTGRYEIFLRTSTQPRRSIQCSGSRCSVSALQVEISYTVWLGTCSGAHPVRCIAHAKPLVISTKPIGNS